MRPFFDGMFSRDTKKRVVEVMMKEIKRLIAEKNKIERRKKTIAMAHLPFFVHQVSQTAKTKI